jgi:hypothetical protein
MPGGLKMGSTSQYGVEGNSRDVLDQKTPELY